MTAILPVWLEADWQVPPPPHLTSTFEGDILAYFPPYIHDCREVLCNTLLPDFPTSSKWAVSSQDVSKAQREQEPFIWNSTLELLDHIYY